MVHCCVLGCKSRSERQDENITFHSFPKDINIRKLWIKSTQRESWEPTKYTRMCSRHFKPQCFRKTNSLTYLYENSTPTLHTNHVNQLESATVEAISIPCQRSVDPVASSSTTILQEQQMSPLHVNNNFTQRVKISPNRKLNLSQEDSPRWKKLKSILSKKTDTIVELRRKLRSVRLKNKRLMKQNLKLLNIISKMKLETLISDQDTDTVSSIDSENKDLTE